MSEAHDIKGLDPMTSYLKFTALKPIKLTDPPKIFWALGSAREIQITPLLSPEAKMRLLVPCWPHTNIHKQLAYTCTDPTPSKIELVTSIKITHLNH